MMESVLPSHNLQLFSLALKDKILSRIELTSACTIVLIDIIEFAHLKMLVGGKRTISGLRTTSETLNEFAAEYGGRAYWLQGDKFVLVLARKLSQSSLTSFIQHAEMQIRRRVGDRRGVVALRAGGCFKVAGVNATHAYETASSAHQNAKLDGLSVAMAESVNVSNSIIDKVTLQRAMQNGEFSLYIQPKRMLKTGMLCGGEALFRWVTPGGEMVPPDVVIPLIHKVGMSDILTNWVIDEVLRVLGHALERGFDGKLAFNVSVHELLSDCLMHRIQHLHKTKPYLLAHLEIEVTEQATLYNDDVAERLAELKQLGVALTLDDFGTGYSNYQVLTSLAFDTIKLDRAFTADLHHLKESKLIVNHIVQLTRMLAKNLVVEGVENQQQCAILQHMGVSQGQGYLFGHPAPARDFLQLITPPKMLKENCL